MTDGMPVENPKDTLALALASGKSLNQASKLAGIPYTSARRLSMKPAFKAKVNELSAAFVELGVRAYGRLLSKAAARLGRLVDSTNDETALKAARGIVADYVSLNDHVHVSARVEEIVGRFADLETRAGLNGHGENGNGRF
jgi:hypothetical protein